MNRGYVIRFLLVAAIVALYCVCSGVGPVSGGSSQQGNGVVVGRVVDDAGKAVASVRVSLLPSDYNPVEGCLYRSF